MREALRDVTFLNRAPIYHKQHRSPEIRSNWGLYLDCYRCTSCYDMADASYWTSHTTTTSPTPMKGSIAERRHQPPKPIRTYSAFNAFNGSHETRSSGTHTRHKSTSTTSSSKRQIVSSRRASAQIAHHHIDKSMQAHSFVAPDTTSSVIPEHDQHGPPTWYAMPSPPITPDEDAGAQVEGSEPLPETMEYDFTKIDYELERARTIGKGLWSTVLLADARSPPLDITHSNLPTPPASPPKRHYALPSSLYAVKLPARADAKDVFRQEAKVLTHLMQSPGANQYVVAFHGLDCRNAALVFEAVLGGSLESLNSRLKQMTEVARHVELVTLFPRLADDLVSGLEFLHAADVVHADIKPANVLLDISEHYSLPHPVIRARYIDFSASFRRDSDDSTANSGGTWDFMAPEQMRIQKALNTPTFASDVWSLGITLLSLLVGGSPYTAACGDNAFLLREAIKSGDPHSFARISPKAQKRMAAAQDFVDCCRLALHKDRERRPSAAAWKVWLVNRELGA